MPRSVRSSRSASSATKQSRSAVCAAAVGAAGAAGAAAAAEGQAPATGCVLPVVDPAVAFAPVATPPVVYAPVAGGGLGLSGGIVASLTAVAGLAAVRLSSKGDSRPPVTPD